jgi:hypothetical protein
MVEALGSDEGQLTTKEGLLQLVDDLREMADRLQQWAPHLAESRLTDPGGLGRPHAHQHGIGPRADMHRAAVPWDGRGALEASHRPRSRVGRLRCAVRPAAYDRCSPEPPRRI